MGRMSDSGREPVCEKLDVLDELGGFVHGARELEQTDMESEFVEAVRSGM